MAQEKFQKLSFELHVIYDMTYVQKCFLTISSGADSSRDAVASYLSFFFIDIAHIPLFNAPT